MVESLTNLKNNKIKPTASGAVDNYSSLKKFLSSLKNKSASSSTEPLRLTLSDIRSSSSKGKWWIVGAAWGGDPLVDNKLKGVLASQEVESDETLMKLAKTHGMNTDIRKSVFVVLMSGEVSRLTCTIILSNTESGLFFESTGLCRRDGEIASIGSDRCSTKRNCSGLASVFRQREA